VIGRGSFRLGPLDLEIAWGERVSLRGPNGVGKSSLLAALTGRLPLVEGVRWIGPSVVIGELGQTRDRWITKAGLLKAFVAESGLSIPDARSLLAKFGLGAEHVRREVRSLSPGERTRAELAAFQAVGVNFLLLDEPTNHLDLPAVEQLESALDAYRGTLVVVSHDRRLLESVEFTRDVDVDAMRASHR
jgi:ATPase subunit of ABC transporter with duplicated ATPase domains